jgi:hypothetical protein
LSTCAGVVPLCVAMRRASRSVSGGSVIMSLSLGSFHAIRIITLDDPAHCKAGEQWSGELSNIGRFSG